MAQGLPPTQGSFAVADVEPASSPLPEVPAEQAFGSLLTAGRRTSPTAFQLEAWSDRVPALVAGVDDHALVAALHLAYTEHRPIALSPDMIWLLICQGVALHIDANAEELRSKFVQHPGRLTLEVQDQPAGTFRRAQAERFWPGVFEGFSNQIEDHLGASHRLFFPAFSTTGPVERTAAEIVLLGSLKKYLHHLVTRVVCGIPAVTLEGTPDDWRTIAERLVGFADLGLGWWLGPLRPVLERIASSAAGEVDRAFWDSMYRSSDSNGVCGPDASSSGWIGLFFPYLVDQEGSATRRNPWLTGWRGAQESPSPRETHRPASRYPEPSMPLLPSRDLPTGLAKAFLTEVERDLEGHPRSTRQMELLAGFIGVTQDPSSLRLRPEIGWAVWDTPPSNG